MHKPLIKGNRKMGPKVYLFNLPPVATCRPTSWCLRGRNGKPACYALRNNFRLPTCIEAAQKRLDFSLSRDFVAIMIEEIQKKRVRFFRWHSSGDFYSAEYARKIHRIVKNCPDTSFRTTTRRRDLTKTLQKLNDLPNMIIRESLDDDFGRPAMGLPFTALDHIPIASRKDNFLCREDCVKCGYYCWAHTDNIVFAQF